MFKFVVGSIHSFIFFRSDAVLDLLSTISISSPRHVEEQTLPLLFSSLPDIAPPRDASAERAKYWRVLSALSVLCVQPELFETLIVRLTTKLDLICVPSSNPASEGRDVEPSAAYAHSILKTVAQTLSTKMDKNHPDVAKYVDRLLPRLYNLFIYSALLSSEQTMVATDHRLISITGEIITLVVQSVSLQSVPPLSQVLWCLNVRRRQETFTAAVFEAFLTGEVKGIAEGHQKIPVEPKFLPFTVFGTSTTRSEPPSERLSVILGFRLCSAQKPCGLVRRSSRTIV